MNNWYVVTVEQNNADELLHMFWEFHDFRIVEVNYSAKKDLVDVLFEYDDRELKVLLRFESNVQLFVAPIDFEVDWIMGAALHSVGNQLEWINCEEDEIDLHDKDDDLTYFRGDQIRWAIIDNKGDRIPIPEKLLHQRWRTLNYETMEYEEEYHDFAVIPNESLKQTSEESNGSEEAEK